MGFFSNILEKLGLKKDTEEEKPAATTGTPAAKAAAPKMTPQERDAIIRSGLPPKAMSEVDVVAKLDTMAAGSGLDWKVSIVDMLKVLGMDSDKESRIELAKELGCPPDLIGGDYAKMNVWLHKEVLKRIAQNGGNIPANLLD
jgi:hypothetical protein